MSEPNFGSPQPVVYEKSRWRIPFLCALLGLATAAVTADKLGYFEPPQPPEPSPQTTLTVTKFIFEGQKVIHYDVRFQDGRLDHYGANNVNGWDELSFVEVTDGATHELFWDHTPIPAKTRESYVAVRKLAREKFPVDDLPWVETDPTTPRAKFPKGETVVLDVDPGRARW